MRLKKVFVVVSLLVAAETVNICGQVIPSDRTTSWVPGVTAGVRGAIPYRTHLIDVTQSPYNADNTGKTDASVGINAAINAAQSNDVVYIPDGTYVLSNQIWFNKSYITLRGNTNSVLVGAYHAGNFIAFGPDQVNYNYNISDTITGGSTKGSMVIQTLENPPNYFTVGDQISISENTTLLGSPNFPVIDVHQYDHSILQQLSVTAITNNVVYLSDPLMFDFTNGPVVIAPGVSTTKGVGLENLIITASNSVTHQVGGYAFQLQISMCSDCWVSNCAVLWAQNYAVMLTASSHINFTHNRISFAQSSGSNHSGLFLSATGEDLVEDNIISDGLTPGIEFNGGCNANAFFANFLTNNVIDIDCHGDHSMMNLWEENMAQGSFEMDGYFGSGSHQTLFRNSFESVFAPLQFKRWISYMNVVGNVLGCQGCTYSNFTDEVNNEGWKIIELGYPNIGNETYVSTSPPIPWNFPGSTFQTVSGLVVPNGYFAFTNNQVNTTNLIGNFTNIPAPIGGVYSIIFQDNVNTNLYYPTNGMPITALAQGTSSNLLITPAFTVKPGWRVFLTGQNGYQQLQSSNKYTDIITGNYDYYHNGVTWDANGPQTLPPSLLYTTGAPSWWGACRWPAIDPAQAPPVTSIPAQNAYLGLPVISSSNVWLSFTADPPVFTNGGITTLTWSVANATNVTIVGLGSVDVGGGSTNVAAAVRTNFTAIASGPTGSLTETVTVVVKPGPIHLQSVSN
ncbi:MAG TPA: glycosyl hydrolase family 28-related protein [Verrucomicrobiae bacterium]|nr:glycosyl hydrolase family 28-related protein [Verrucomicrobiae bacterium]